MTSNSDIIEIKLLDSSFCTFHKDKARIKDKKDMERLNENLESKIGMTLTKKKEYGWFD